MKRIGFLAVVSMFLFALGSNIAGDSPQSLTPECHKHGSGLVAHYYRDEYQWEGKWTEKDKPDAGVDCEDHTFTYYRESRIEPLLNHLFVKKGWFSIRWVGYITIEEGGTYNFELWADDGCRLKINDQVVVDSWEAAWEQAEESRRKGTVADLQPGKHRIVIEYFQGPSLTDEKDHDPCKLLWTVPGRGKKIVPASAFSHKAEDLAPLPGRLGNDPEMEGEDAKKK